MKTIPAIPLDNRLPGKRQTQQRKAIHQYLMNTSNHPSAEEIFNDLRKQYPTLSLATVYNTLELLLTSGKIGSIGNTNDHNIRFDRNTETHINLLCTRCHKIEDLSYDRLGEIEHHIETHSTFSISQAQILYSGLCQDCQQKDHNLTVEN